MSFCMLFKEVYYNRAATMLLAQNLKALGLEIVPTKDAFEIAGISRELIEKFSRRTKTIEEYAEKHGITDPVEKAKIAALTRERKAKSLLISELEPFWWASLTPEEAQALDRVGRVLQRSRAVELSRQMAGGAGMAANAAIEAGASSDFLGTRKQAGAGAVGRQSMNQKTRPVESPGEPVKVTEHDRRAVALAMEHIFERASVVTERQLIAEASRNWCVGRATLQGINEVVAEAPLLRREWNGKRCRVFHHGVVSAVFRIKFRTR